MELNVYHKGQKICVLNERLIRQQGLGDKEIQVIKFLHCQKFNVLQKMEQTDSSSILRELAKEIEEIEFELQQAWKFPQDHRYHEWYMVPKCACPKIDNKDAKGTDYRITTSTCPIHGTQIAEVDEPVVI